MDFAKNWVKEIRANSPGVDNSQHAILINGCSFSLISSGYWRFLPGREIYNIAQRGSGINYDHRLQRFFEFKNTCKSKKFRRQPLTHFIYQVPDPARQPLDLESSTERLWSVHRCGYTNMDKVLWFSLVEGDISVFEKQEAYFKKAIDRVQESVNLIRARQIAWRSGLEPLIPDVDNIKIIFLRYAYRLHPLVYEFSYPFYKNILSDFCKKNNITYIYEDNFESKWFVDNGLCADDCHPNKAGAKMIADKIIEYL